jgi:hypothetical protein
MRPHRAGGEQGHQGGEGERIAHGAGTASG